ncbi:hypothetical protein MTR67_048518 [Solanum verrucosum]|uniref:Reverse transcriptase domain-containing protein n=1 Tax=Solanum verrucosum TaxID=315347 RepID=A0AAF0UY42_SOLVR|nr:hypothetical protein MTR67_048518 [Solanum verrucosum]
MLFGLTNALSTDYSLMNQFFSPYVRKFILVFFDDMLIYSSSWRDHLLHLEEVFRTLRANKLFAKKSKCAFGLTQVNYLGHIVSVHGVAMDGQKGYGSIARPLTDLLKNSSFTFSETATHAFEQLKLAITSALILALPDFTKEFVVETDASGDDIGAVLDQEGKSIAFFLF